MQELGSIRNKDNIEENRIKEKLKELILKQIDHTNPAPLNVYEIRNYIYYGYNDPELRARYWKILLNYFPQNKFTTESFYKQARESYKKIVEEKFNDPLYSDIKVQVTSELERSSLSKDEKSTFLRILVVFCILNPSLGYVQGMENLVRVLFHVISTDCDISSTVFAEEDTFCMFNNLVSENANNFIQEFDDQKNGVKETIKKMFYIIKEKDRKLYDVLSSKKITETIFPLRWILFMYSLEYPIEKVVWLWDKILSDAYRFELLTYLAAASVILMRDVLLKEEFENCMTVLQTPSVIPVEVLFDIADAMRREKKDAVQIISERFKSD